MNLPNKITLSRLILAPAYTAIMLSPLEKTTKAFIASALFFFTALTDFLDGYIARKRKIVTDFGRFLDPVADKVMIFGALCGLIFMNSDNRILSLCLIVATFVFFVREITITTLRMIVGTKSGVVIAAGLSGKIKTVSQIVFVLTALLEPILFSNLFDVDFILTYITMAFMTLMTILSGIVYFKAYFPLINTKK